MSRPPRIVVVTPYAYPAERWGGPVPAIHHWCEALASEGWHVEVLTTDADVDGHVDVELGRVVDVGGLPHRYHRAWTGLPLFVSPTLSRAVARSAGSADILWSHGLWTTPGYVAAAAAFAHRVPHVVTPHGSLHPWSLRRNATSKKLLLATIEGQRLARATVHFTCTQERRLAESLYSVGNCVIAPCIVEPPVEAQHLDARDWLGIPNGAPIVLYLSRIHPKKGVDLLIDAFARLDERTHLVIAGPGDAEYVEARRRQCGDHGIAARVHLPGMVTGAHKQALLRQSNVFCLPSHQENFGIVVAEAMHEGLPVVLSRHVDIWSEVVGAQAGVAIEMTPGSIADALTDVIARPDAAKIMGEKGRSYAMNAYRRRPIGRTLSYAFGALCKTGSPDSSGIHPRGETCPD